jgi:hypothetical protein
MYADDTTIFNIGKDISELQRNSDNTGLVKQYFETNNLFINPTQTHFILFQTKQYRQRSKFKILI